VKVEYMDDGAIKLSQPHLIQQIIDDIGFNERTTSKPTPAQSTVRLSRDLHGMPRVDDWHYRSIIGKLNFLEKSTRPDIAYAVHQCARFATDPKLSHEAAVKRIVKYLVGTKNDGIYIRPNGHSFDCYVDADFVGNWDRVNADVDPSTAKSRTGYIISYGGCPVSWASKLQTDVALSTTEAEYTALSTSLREVIHLMQLVEEAHEMGWETYSDAPVVHCKVFEDNVGALEMARLPKMRPRTKHLCTRMHHFRERVRKGLITILHIDTKDQLADMLTKPQPEELFTAQRPLIMCLPLKQQDEPSPLRACGITNENTLSPKNTSSPTGTDVSELNVNNVIGMHGVKCNAVLKHSEVLEDGRKMHVPSKIQSNENICIVTSECASKRSIDPIVNRSEESLDLSKCDAMECKFIGPEMVESFTYEGEEKALRESVEIYTKVERSRQKRGKSGPKDEAKGHFQKSKGSNTSGSSSN
jgi:hypothetical protein